MKSILKTLVFAITLLGFTASKAQNISTEFYQDLKLITVGDTDNGINPGTLDMIARLNLNGKQDTYGFFTVSPQFEYANITGIYKRYSFSVGYTLNQLYSNSHFFDALLQKSQFYIGIDYGFIERFGKAFIGFGGSAAYKYQIADNIKVTALLQLTDRKDLKFFYNDNNTIAFSGFVGVEINLFNINLKR
jgi:hypothetical protein